GLAALRHERTELDEQLAATRATNDERQQELARELHETRQHRVQLEQERAALQAAFAAAQQRAGEVDTAHAGTVAQLRSEAAELRKQMKTVTAARTRLTERLERAEQAQTSQRERLEGES